MKCRNNEGFMKMAKAGHRLKQQVWTMCILGTRKHTESPQGFFQKRLMERKIRKTGNSGQLFVQKKKKETSKITNYSIFVKPALTIATNQKLGKCHPWTQYL